VDLLAEAMMLLSAPNWECRLAGEGNLRADIEPLGIPGLRFLGNLAWDRLREELRHASCIVLPTRADTSPNVIKEARVVGLPVITSSHGGQAGYIIDGENGLIVNPLDAENLAKSLSTLMENPKLAQSMGATRHMEDRDYLLSSRTAQSFAKLYRELASPAYQSSPDQPLQSSLP
jgi:glycosyltransferase involved in cell wall biosynthesis